ncbi:MAG: FRG domain-containing protein [Ruminococcus flavefaciens]|nr:FRG domain-containing protein [Ruminococcus flavefaciens]
MRGYLLNFYKFSPTVVDLDLGNSSDFVRSIVWSDFDRVEIRNIDKFEEYRVSKYSEKNWLGDRQFAMIYEFDDSYSSLKYLGEAAYEDGTIDECRFVFDIPNENERFKMRFFGITFMDFTPEMHQFCYRTENEHENSGKKIHSMLREMIGDVITQNGIQLDDISYEVYGVLGGQDAVVIWLAYQFEDIARVLEGIRKSKAKDGKGILSNIYTIIGLKNVNDPQANYDDVKGRLHIKLTKRETFDEEKFQNDLDKLEKELEPIICDVIRNKKNSHMLFGEHDLMFTMSGMNLVSALYRRDGIFNSKAPVFYHNFMQSKTEVTVETNYENVKGVDFSFDLTDRDIEKISSEKIRKYIAKIEEIAKSDCFKKAKYLQETLWLLYEEFLKNRASTFSYPWISDLEYQFDNCLEYLLCLVKDTIDNDKKYKNIHELITSMRQMILHVAQSNRIFFEIPNMHLRYTGAYSKILHTYYGVMKCYLRLLYSVPRYDSQAPIIPFMLFDVTPKVKSKYLDRVKGYDNNIVRFEMPYEALVNISKYNKLLAHEIYHYIAPVDRHIRNMLVATISFSTIMGQMCNLYLRELALNIPEYVQCDKTNKATQLIWGNYFTKIATAVEENILKIDDLEGVIQTVISGYEGNDEWNIYFSKFDNGIKMNLKKSSTLTHILFKAMKELDLTIYKEDEQFVVLYEMLKNSDESDFINWVEQKLPINKITNFDKHFRYSLREAMADYFMMQVSDMDIPEYLSLVYEYQDMLAKDSNNIRIQFRIALICDLYFGDSIREQIDINGKEGVEVLTDVENWISKNLSIKENIHELSQCYTQLLVVLSPYREIIKQYFSMLDFSVYNREQYYPEFVQSYKILKDLLNKDFEREFDENIFWVEIFQNQEELRNLSKKIKNLPSEDRKNVICTRVTEKTVLPMTKIQNPLNTSYQARNLTELINTINGAIGRITDENDSSPIWFRGQESKRYKLLPSIYRMKDKSSQFYNTSMRRTLKSLLDLFKAKAYNAPELIGNSETVDANCLITMQHYSMPTNIMDWTTSAFTALYFALEKELNNEERIVAEDAVIYLLNPIRLNLAREYLMTPIGNAGKKGVLNFPIPALVGDDKDFEDYLPSFSIEENKIEYPMAVYVPFVNQRIKAQLGTFTLFGLDNEAADVLDKGKVSAKDFSAHSLVEMQKIYQETCEKAGDKSLYKPFLTKVEIREDKKKQIADSLCKLGIQKKNIYPELDNVSQELLSEVKAYFSMV